MPLRATLAVLALLVPAGSPVNPAAPAAQPGWRPVWSNDFTGSALPSQCTTYGSPHGGPADSYYTPDEVSVAGGMLRLGMRYLPKNGRNYATGGVTCYKVTQRYGKFEYRAKPPLGQGIDAYATLWPPDETPDDNVLIETLPRPGQERVYYSSNDGATSVHTDFGGAYSGSFHTYTIEWSPGLLRILIDGAVKLTDHHPGTAPKWIGWAVSSGDPLTGEPDSATKLPTEFDVDWVHVYAYVPGAAAAATPAASRSAPPPPASASANASANQSAAPASAAAAGAVAGAPSGPTLTATAQRGSGSGLVWAVLATVAALFLLIGGYALRRRGGRRGGAHASTG